MYSSTIATSKTAASTPDKLCLQTASAMNRQLWRRQALSALNAETPSQKNQKNINQQFRILILPRITRYSQTQPIPLHERPLLFRLQTTRLYLFAQHGRRVVEHARHRLQVLFVSSSPSQATLTTNSSPRAARLIANILRMLYSPWFSN